MGGLAAATFAAPREASAWQSRSTSRPVLGTEATGYQGWTEIATQVHASSGPFDGEVSAEVSRYGSDGPTVLVRQPVHVDANRSETFLVPLQVQSRGGGSVEIVLRDRAGQVVQRDYVNANGGVAGPLVATLDGTFAAARIKNSALQTSNLSRSSAYDTSPRLQVSGAELDPTTRRPILPTRTTTYHSVTVAVASGDTLTSMTPTELEALSTWVRSGGALVVLHAPGAAVAPWLGPDGPREKRLPVGAGAMHFLSTSELPAKGVVATHNDAWVEERVVAITSERWNSHRSALPLGSGSAVVGAHEALRRELDPNEGFRPALGFAALALVRYAALVGPLAFAYARRRKRPFLPMLTTPALSLGAFVTVVGVGFATKGVHGRATHLSYVELQSGEQTGTVRNFRAFYTTDQRDLTVAPMARASVLDGARDDSAQGTFVVRGDGSGSLQGVRTMPWQSLLVREDGLLDVAKGGITLEDDGSEIAVVNRSGRDLADVLVFRNGSTWHFAKVAAGERVTTAGRGASSGGASSHSNADDGNGPKSFVQINWYGLRTSLAGGERIADQWASVESSMGYGHDWSGGSDTFLLARMEGGASEDSGLPVKKSTTLVRVTRGSR